MTETAYLQLRWEKEDDFNFLCHYELVLPLGEYDIRREDDDGEKVLNSQVIKISDPTRRGTSAVPCGDGMKNQRFFDTPYRDGAHALWDSVKLGNIPIKVMTIDGLLLDEPEDWIHKRERLNRE